MPVSIERQRQDALRARRALSDEARAAASQTICGRVVTSREFRAARSIGCFLPMHDEVDTHEIIDRAWRANKRVYVPILRRHAGMLFCEIKPETELQRDRFGIYEPVRGVVADPRMFEIILTPLVAFDADNNRIGMGSGYYDRCFAFLRHRDTWLRPKLIGVAFRCQQVEKIYPNPWDIPLYRVVTDRELPFS